MRTGTHDPNLVESVKPPRNAVNIFWEYAKKEIGQAFADPMKNLIKDKMPPGEQKDALLEFVRF